MNALELLVDMLAAWRLTHLVTDDVFPPIEDARTAIKQHYGLDHPVSYLLSCVFCSGVWVAAGVSVARRVAPGPWRAVARLLALAAAAPLVEAALNRLEAP